MKLSGPDSWVSWKNAVLAGLVQIPVLICQKTMGVVFVNFLDEWHLARGQASRLLTLFIVSSQISAPVFPLLQKSFSPAYLLTFFCALLSCSQLLVYFSENIWHFGVLFCLQGAAVGGMYVFSTLIYMQHFKSKRTAAAGLASIISSGSTTFVPILAQSLITKLGLRIAVPVLSISSLVSVVLSFFLKIPPWYLAEQMKQKEIALGSRVDDKELIPLEKTAPGSKSAGFVFDPTWQYLWSSRFALDVFCVVAIYNAHNTFLMISHDYVRDQGIPEQSALYVVPMCSVGDLTMRLVSGFLIDSKIVRWTAFIEGVFLVEAVCVSIWLMCSRLSFFLVLSLLIGGCNGSLVSLIPVLLANDFGVERFTSTLGVSLFVCGVGSIFRPFLDGYFRDVRGNYDGLFIIIVGSCIPCAIYWFRRTIEESRAATNELPAEEDISKNLVSPAIRESAF